MAIHYLHSQRATVILAATLPVPILTIPILLIAPNKPWWLIALLILLTIVGAVLFSSLTVSVDDTTLTWWFGIGLVRKSVPLADIVAAQPIRTSFLEGWGIHRTRYGWLYNVSGFDAVWIQRRSGKTFALGTNDVDGLHRALLAALPKSDALQNP